MATFPHCSECGCDMFELAEVEAKMCTGCQNRNKPSVPYFTATIKVPLDEDILADCRSMGMQDTAIIHEVCDELLKGAGPRLTNVDKPYLEDCEIKTGDMDSDSFESRVSQYCRDEGWQDPDGN